MYLKKLTISGFKSFAKKSELEFSSPITSVVGPNGSGKSNVAESFRFVLGEQSVKSMRGKRGEDLIWGGSAEVARGNRANVILVLDNSSKIFPLDFQEIILERTVHRDGQNEYFINGSNVRLKDVQELLASANIGATGHHIISQGEADRVLSANEKERREMVEDALGLKIYQYKRNEAEKKLAKTLENVAQVELLRREAAPHLRYLEKQMQKIKKSLELQETLKKTYAEYLKREDLYLAFWQEELLGKEKKPKEELKNLEEKIKKAKEVLSVKENKPDTEEVFAIEEKIKKATSERQSAERDFNKCDGQIVFLKRRIESLERVAKVPKAKTFSYEEVVSLVKTIEEKTKKALSGTEVSFLQRALFDVLHVLKLFIEKSGNKEQSSEEGLILDKKELNELEQLLLSLKEKVEEKQKQEEEFRKEYYELEKKKNSELAENHELEKEIFSLINKKRDLENEIEKCERELAVISRERQEFKNELQEAVALLGRGAAYYINFKILDSEEKEISEEKIVNEERRFQRERRHELEKLKIRLEELGVGQTEDIEKEYNDAKDREVFLSGELEDLRNSIEKLKILIEDQENKLEELFSAGIGKISQEFNRFFSLMFGGGKAELVKVEKKEIEEGVEEGEKQKIQTGLKLSIQLPNKKVKGLEMLSGGERALTSIALIFAMSQVNPPPFIILDETDAALDEANSRRYGDMIEELAKKSQLIVITHNRETMSRAGILYGVTMGGDGISKLLSIKLDDAVKVAK